MLLEIKSDSKEHCENDIIILTEHHNAEVIEKPHSWNNKDWFATVKMPKRKEIQNHG